MKKNISILIIVLFILGISIFFIRSIVFANDNKEFEGSKNVQVSLSKKVIRFHILANSDSEEDQNLKLKIRDEVLKYIAPKLEASKNINESRKLLQENDVEIKKIAEKVVEERGYKYDIKTELAQVNFPVKAYGNIVFPQGRYEAYRILIGKAEGHNWWCVMFPPLCFIDITKGKIEEKATENEMKKALTKEEYKVVDNSKEEDKVILKSKLVEEIQKFIKGLK